MAISVSQTFKRTSANPIDESMALTKAQMKTVNDNLMPAYYFTICQNDGKIYLYDKTATVSEETGKFREFESGTTITVDSSLSTTSENPVQNKVITLAMGVLSNLTTTDKTSLVNAVNEINAKVVTMTGGHTIQDTDGTDMPAEDNLQFVGLDVQDDSTNDATTVEAFGLNSDSLDDVVDGSIGNEIINNGMCYSTNEQIVGKWIDGNPLYQKTFQVTTPSSSNVTTNVVDISSLNLGYVQNIEGSVIDAYGSWAPINVTEDGTQTSGIGNRVATWIRYTKEHIAMNVTGSDYLDRPAYVTLRYTKATS